MQEPLRKIQTFSTRILEKEINNLTESGKDYFQRMQFAAARMQKLIDDLLTFSRINSSERKFVKSDLKLIINDVIQEHQDTILEKKAIIEIKEICEINIIPFQFRQLINNLLANSLKFSIPDIPPHIIINCSAIVGSTLINTKLIPKLNYSHLSFTDNGIGFEQHFGEKIFEVFQKLHQRDEYAGTGIGLAIVKKIVETHNGIISVKSDLGKGSTFDIYIPANQ
jgi:light-regulated signal transduction histidine kinase (bacteriophytochrome)